MVQLFRDLSRGELERGGIGGLIGLWLRTLLELIRTATKERMRKGYSVAFGSVFTLRNAISLCGTAAVSGGTLLIAFWLFAITTSLRTTGAGSDLLLTSWFVRTALFLLLVAGLVGLYICVIKEAENARRAKLLATVGLIPLLAVVTVSILGFPNLSMQVWPLVLAAGILVVSSIFAGILDRKAVFPLILILIWVPPMSEAVRILGDAVYSLTIEPIYLVLDPQVRNQTGLPNPTLSRIDAFLYNVLFGALPSILVGIGWILLGRMIRNSAPAGREDSSSGLEELQQLHAAGVLTDEEFSNARLRLPNR